jgi:MFS family permease
VGGALGDWAFKRNVRGRIIVSSAGVLMGAIFLYLAIKTPVYDQTQFFILMALTALFMPLSSPNVLATIFDITPPEVRSTAQAVEYFVESSGAALAPLMAGIIADALNLEISILTICTISWLLCFIFYLGALFTIKTDVHSLRVQMEERANIERAKHAPAA